MILGLGKKKWTERQGSSVGPRAVLPPDRELLAEIALVEADLGKGALDEAQVRLDRLAESHPGDPRVLANLGICRFRSGDAAGATEPLVAAIKAVPGDGRTHKYLAAALDEIGDHSGTLAIARRASELLPLDVDPLLLAANASIRLGAYGEAAGFLNRALKIQPESVPALHRLEIVSKNSTVAGTVFESDAKVSASRRRVVNRLLASHRRHGLDTQQLVALLAMLEAVPEKFPVAVEIARADGNADDLPVALAEQMAAVLLIAGDGQAAVRLYEHCFDQDTENLNCRISLSQSWLMTDPGTWREAWRMMTDALYRGRPFIHPQEATLWDGKRLGKSKVLVYQDQGVGDAIMALRFLPLLVERGFPFELWVAPALADLVARIPGCERVIRAPTRPEPASRGCEYAVPLFGLITALQVGFDEIGAPPVFGADPEAARPLRERVRALPGVRIGLIGGGNPLRRDDWLRSVPLYALAPLAALPGVSWVNLMIDERPDKAALLARFSMTDPMPGVRSFSDTAAIVEELDAVVAVDSSVAHVAANAGKPLWVLVPTAIDWRWQMGQHLSPWWPAARLLRSEAPGKWTGTVKSLAADVGAFVAQRSPAAVT